jgi:hypothetical protein
MRPTTIILTSIPTTPIPIPIIVTVSTPFAPAVPVPVPVSIFSFSISAIMTMTMIARTRMMATIVVVAHTLEQAQLAIRWRRWRRIVALPSPRSRNPNLRILFLSETIWAGAVTFCASDPTIAHIPRICEPIVLVVLLLLLLLQLESAPFHSRPIFVARTLADIYRGVCAPAVAESFPILPVARCASVQGSRSGIRERSREYVPQAKGRRRV